MNNNKIKKKENYENSDKNEQDLKQEEITDVKQELNEALDVGKIISVKPKEISVTKIIDAQASNGEEITSQKVQDAFKLLQKQLNQDDEQVEDEKEEEEDDDDDDDELQEEEEKLDEASSVNDLDVDELQEEEEEDQLEVELEDGVEEYENELSEYDDNEVEDLSPEAEQALSEEIDEAMQIASELGKQAREELSLKYYESFIEVTGQEPSQEQINGIFQRMQEELSLEAEEELFDNYEESYGDECGDVASLLLNKISNLDNEDKKEMFEESQSIISQETQNEVKQQYSDSWGKEPNEEEFQDILISLAQTKFTDEYFTDNNDEDYDPEQDSQQDEQENDEDEYSSDLDDEVESLKKDIGSEILQHCWQAFETKFGRAPNYDEQITNVELLINSEQFQQFCQTTAVESNPAENSDAVEESDPVEE